MAEYLKISYPKGDPPRSNSLKRAITYLGKYYGKLANKNGHTDDDYFINGEIFIARKMGSHRKTAIRRMTESEKGNDPDNRQWYYHRRIYGKAYRNIVRWLRKRLIKDKEDVTKILDDLYRSICKETGERGNNLERLYSNALVFWQKDMLELFVINPITQIDDIEAAGKILGIIKEVDKPLPTIT